MQMLLSKSLFNDFWPHLAARLNDYILKEVIILFTTYCRHMYSFLKHELKKEDVMNLQF